MALLAEANASVIPKEFADKGWRKAALTIVLVVCITAVMIAILVIRHADELAMTVCAPGILILFGLAKWYFKLNLEGYQEPSNEQTAALIAQIKQLRAIQTVTQTTEEKV